MKKNKKQIIFSGVMLFLFSGVGLASAIEYGMLGGKPAFPDKNIENSEAWFMYNIPVGQSKEDAIEVMNLFETPLDVVVYAADTIKSSGGGFALKQFSEENSEVGTWVKFYPDPIPEDFKGLFEKKEKKIIEICKLSKEEIAEDEEFIKAESIVENFSKLQEWCKGKKVVEKNFASKERTMIPFIFSVPENADAGEHTGGILIQKKATEDVSQGGGSSVKLTTRVGVRIYQTVPGEIIKRIKIESFGVKKHFSEFSFSDWFGEQKKPKEFLVETHITNSGNVSIEHENNLQIKDLLFGKKNKDIIRKFQILKGDKFLANYSWKKPLFGRYSFQSEIKYNNGSSEEILKSDVVKMWVIPWREITLLAIFLALVGIGVYFWKRRQKKLYGGHGWIAYEVQKGDTIASLSEKCSVDWKVLAKTNRMKPPYFLTEGDPILVPAIKGQKIEVVNTKEIVNEIEEKVETSVPKKRGRKPVRSGKKVMEMKKEAVDDFELLSGPLENTEVDLENKDEKKVEEKSCKGKECAEKMKSFGELLSRNKWFVVGGIVFLAMLFAIVYLAASLQDFKKEMNETNNQLAPSMKVEENPVQIQPEKKEEPKSEEVVKEKEDEKSQESAHKKEDLKVAILNGGGAPGSAGKLKTFLIEEGYSLTEASNAKGDSYTGKKIYYAEGFEIDAKTLSEEISDGDEKVPTEKGIPEGEDEGDLIIVLGK